MKFRNLIPILILIVAIGLSFVLCGDDDDNTPTATPTPTVTPTPTPVCPTCFSLNAGGVIVQFLYETKCLFKCYPTVTKEAAVAMSRDIDVLWSALQTQMCASTFNATAVTDTLADVFSAENIALLKPVIVDALAKADSTTPLLTCETVTTISGYITQALTSTSDLYTKTLNNYVDMIGITAEKAFEVISGGVTALNTTLKLTDAITALNCGGTMGTECPNCVAGVWTIVQYLTDSTVETNEQWGTAVDGVMSLMTPLLTDVVNLFKALHDNLTSTTLLCTLIPNLPSLLLGLLTDSIESNCDVACE